MDINSSFDRFEESVRSDIQRFGNRVILCTIATYVTMTVILTAVVLLAK